MQVTYLEAFLRIGAFTPGGPRAFGAWLRRIAENNLRDAIRSSDAADRRRSPAASPSGDSCRGLVELVAGGDTPIRLAGRGEAEGLLEAALRQLPDDYQRVLRLYDLEGHSGPEMARLIGRSHGAVKMLVGSVSYSARGRSSFRTGRDFGRAGLADYERRPSVEAPCAWEAVIFLPKLWRASAP